MSRQARDIEDQNQHERMAEVRSYKRRTEDISNKIRRCSSNKELVANTNKAIENINNAIDTLMTNINIIDCNESAWALQCNTTDELFNKKTKCSRPLMNKLRNLNKFKRSVLKAKNIDDLSVLDLFEMLKSPDLVDTTLRIIEEENRKPTLIVVIETIKKIHVDGLKNFNIPRQTLNTFCNCHYVKPTRKTNDLITMGETIHQKFEQKLLKKSQPERKRSQRTFDTITPDPNNWDEYDYP
jgi:hypothetical protein